MPTPCVLQQFGLCIEPTISIITLNVNGQNTTIKGKECYNGFKKRFNYKIKLKGNKMKMAYHSKQFFKKYLGFIFTHLSSKLSKVSGCHPDMERCNAMTYSKAQGRFMLKMSCNHFLKLL